MGRWIRLWLVVLFVATGLGVTSCGRRGGQQAASGTYGDTMRARHHSVIGGALVGAAAGHMAGHHAIVGAITGAVIQHERNKHQR